jgi:hypothetical protein
MVSTQTLVIATVDIDDVGSCQDYKETGAMGFPNTNN